ncbi:hypothetical protein Tco_1108394 [Tanacetum coccineum]
MILRDGDERLILNMRHDTSSYSNKPKKESINMIDIYNVSHKDYLEDLFANEKITNHQSGNPTFSSHTNLTSLEVINLLSGNPTPISEPVTKSSSSPIITSLEESELIWEEFEAYLVSDSFPPGNDDLVDLLLEEFADKLALITFPPGNDDLPFDIELRFLGNRIFGLHDLPKKWIIFSRIQLMRDFSEVDALPSTNNEDRILMLLFMNFLSTKKFSGLKLYSRFHPKMRKKVRASPGILTSKGVHTSLLPELFHRGPKAFKVIKIFKSPMEIFPCSYGEDIRVLDVPCLHSIPLYQFKYEGNLVKLT